MTKPRPCAHCGHDKQFHLPNEDPVEKGCVVGHFYADTACPCWEYEEAEWGMIARGILVRLEEPGKFFVRTDLDPWTYQRGPSARENWLTLALVCLAVGAALTAWWASNR